MINVNTDNYEEFIKSSEVVVVDLFAEWCGPCKVLGPIVESVSLEYEVEYPNVKIAKMNVDDNRDKSIELGVTSIPTILIYKNGTLVDRHTGMAQKTKLKDMIKKHM